MKCGSCGTARIAENDYLCRGCRARQGMGDTINEVQIMSYDENVAPPYDVLRVARAGEVIFFEIADYEEGNNTTTLENRSTFGVTLRDLKKALDALDF